MKRIKIIGLALVAVFAISAVAAASASALPEFSGFAAGEKFKAKAGAGSLDTAGTVGKQRHVNCTAGGGEGTIEATKTSKTTVKFTGCKAAGGFASIPCKTVGANAEEIVTKALVGKLKYLNEAKKEVVLVLEPEVAGGLFAEFTCEGLGVTEKIKVKGTSIGQLTPVNTLTKTTTLTFKETAKASGKQSILEYEEAAKKVKPLLNETEGVGTGFGSESWAFEESAVEGVSTQETAKEIEVKA